MPETGDAFKTHLARALRHLVCADLIYAEKYNLKTLNYYPQLTLHQIMTKNSIFLIKMFFNKIHFEKKYIYMRFR